MRHAARHSVRVVFDVNVLIRVVLRSARMARLLDRTADSSHTILTCDLLMSEFSATVRKPRLVRHVDWDVYNRLVGFFSLAAESVHVQPPFPTCRDRNDGYLLAMADVGRATNLVSLDDDLLVQAHHGACIIESPEAFEARLISAE